MTGSRFDQLVAEALAQDFSGWDFSWTRGRWFEADPSWNYRQLVQDKAAQVDSLLDMGTGGGEFLASLPHRPTKTYATESYPPNLPVAQVRLEPLGVKVVTFKEDSALPLPDGAFQLVINRHESYSPSEVRRILKPDGIFLTQQVGPANCMQLNQFLGASTDPNAENWSSQREAQPLEEAGFQILRCEEEFPEGVFHDIGVVVFYLKIISWQIPDFEVAKYHDRLLTMHELIEREGAFRATAHRLLIEAKKAS